MTDHDFLRVLVRIIGGTVLLLTLCASFLLYYAKPHTALYLVAVIVFLILIDLRLYWVHEIHHAQLIADPFLVWLVASWLFYELTV
jgi:hypothetical protein